MFDCMWGIVIGVILVGFTGIFFTLPEIPTLWGVLFAVSAIATVIDVVLCLKDFGEMHKLLLAAIIISSVVYIVVELGMVAKYLNLAIPFITASVVPVFSQPMMLVYLGVFFIATSIIWLIDTLRAR